MQSYTFPQTTDLFQEKYQETICSIFFRNRNCQNEVYALVAILSLLFFEAAVDVHEWYYLMSFGFHESYIYFI